jgi:hypothetical protein
MTSPQIRSPNYLKKEGPPFGSPRNTFIFLRRHCPVQVQWVFLSCAKAPPENFPYHTLHDIRARKIFPGNQSAKRNFPCDCSHN